MGRPIRVAMIMGKLVAGGVESIIFNYYRCMDHNKIHMDFFYDEDSVVEPPEDLVAMGVHFYKNPPYQKILHYIAVLKRCFKKGHYDIVHSNINTLSVFPLYAAWRAKIPVRICHNHSTAGHGEYKKNFFKYTLRPFAGLFATEYCACSRYAGKWMFGKKAIETGRVTIFNNAIDLEKYCFDPSKREEMRRTFGIEEKFVVGHVGRFRYQKNHDFLIDIFTEIHRNNPNSILLLIGDGELMEKIKSKVNRLGLKESVRFLGIQKDVCQLYQAMDVFVLPSRYEGLPVVALEAQASGLPVVCSDKVTHDTKVTDNICFFPLQADSRKWAKLILRISRDFHRKSVEKSFQISDFDIRKESGKMERFYSRLSARL